MIKEEKPLNIQISHFVQKPRFSQMGTRRRANKVNRRSQLYNRLKQPIKDPNFTIQDHKALITKGKETVLKIRAVFGSRKVHLDIIKGFTLAEIVVISGSEKARSMTSHYGFQVATVNIECKSFESVHDQTR